jgi:hypothetical protein
VDQYAPVLQAALLALMDGEFGPRNTIGQLSESFERIKPKAAEIRRLELDFLSGGGTKRNLKDQLGHE